MREEREEGEGERWEVGDEGKRKEERQWQTTHTHKHTYENKGALAYGADRHMHAQTHPYTRTHNNRIVKTNKQKTNEKSRALHEREGTGLDAVHWR